MGFPIVSPLQPQQLTHWNRVNSCAGTPLGLGFASVAVGTKKRGNPLKRGRGVSVHGQCAGVHGQCAGRQAHRQGRCVGRHAGRHAKAAVSRLRANDGKRTDKSCVCANLCTHDTSLSASSLVSSRSIKSAKTITDNGDRSRKLGAIGPLTKKPVEWLDYVWRPPVVVPCWYG